MWSQAKAVLTKPTFIQALKFTASEDEEELEEENLLETPLDQVEPYGVFKTSLISQ